MKNYLLKLREYVIWVVAILLIVNIWAWNTHTDEVEIMVNTVTSSVHQKLDSNAMLIMQTAEQTMINTSRLDSNIVLLKNINDGVVGDQTPE